jgi:opacity protein-like surface antigen
MKNSLTACAAFAFFALAGAASAQDAIMNSAETINQDNFKFSGYPIFTLGDDSETGIGVRAGYGFSRGFDAEAKISHFDGLTYYGLDGEWWVHHKDPDVSFALGVHRSSLDGGFDIVGVDTTLLASQHVARNLEVYGGLRVAFEFPDEGDSFRRIHLVPGIEYRVAKDLDFLAELGIKLNDRSTSYVAVGLAYYVR